MHPSVNELFSGALIDEYTSWQCVNADRAAYIGACGRAALRLVPDGHFKQTPIAANGQKQSLRMCESDLINWPNLLPINYFPGSADLCRFNGFSARVSKSEEIFRKSPA